MRNKIKLNRVKTMVESLPEQQGRNEIIELLEKYILEDIEETAKFESTLDLIHSISQDAKKFRAK